jgi:hypothetical protein
LLQNPSHSVSNRQEAGTFRFFVLTSYRKGGAYRMVRLFAVGPGLPMTVLI